MILEREAKKRWCPFGARAAGNGSSINRGSEDQPMTLCLGRACMAWRWGPLMETGDPENGVLGSMIDAPTGFEDKLYKPRKGFCGIAGKTSK